MLGFICIILAWIGMFGGIIRIVYEGDKEYLTKKTSRHWGYGLFAASVLFYISVVSLIS